MRSPHSILLLVFTGATVGAAPAGRSWFEQVERDRDRGAGRIVDRSTWDIQRMQDDRDVRLGRLAPRREFDRLDEERDRQLQTEAQPRRQAQRHRRGLGVSASDQSAILSDPPLSGGAGLPTLAAVVAHDQRELAEAKQTLERSLKAVDAAEARELRLLRRRLNREGKADHFDAERRAIRGRYERLRADHQRQFEAIRTRILGH